MKKSNPPIWSNPGLIVIFNSVLQIALGTIAMTGHLAHDGLHLGFLVLPGFMVGVGFAGLGVRGRKSSPLARTIVIFLNAVITFFGGTFYLGVCVIAFLVGNSLGFGFGVSIFWVVFMTSFIMNMIYIPMLPIEQFSGPLYI